MEIVFTQHAKIRMAARNIEEEDVIYTLLKPDKYEPTYQNRIKVQKRIGGKILTVIYVEERNIMIVLTCYSL